MSAAEALTSSETLSLRPCAGPCGMLTATTRLDAQDRCPKCVPSAPVTRCGYCLAEVALDAAHVHAFNLLCDDCHAHRRSLSARGAL